MVLRIAQIAPLYESVPPRGYGGTERVVAYLADALVDLGHDVTLFASGDSGTRAKLVACREQAIWRNRNELSAENAAHFALLDKVRQRADEFDILHFHIDLLPFLMFEDFADRTLTTMHGRLDIEDLKAFYRRWSRYPLASISDSQRAPLSFANWAGTVYHGLPLDLLQPVPNPSRDYLAFIGRVSPEKRPDVAIRLALRAGRTIQLAAKVQPPDASYFRDHVEPLLDQPGVKFVGEINDRTKRDFLSNAEAMLFPISWPEPFGMVLIEAMACGTPVIAWNCGAVPEIIEDGVTGFIVNSEDEAMEAIRRIRDLDRSRIRTEFERRFSARQMALSYVELFRQLLSPRIIREASVGAAAVTAPVESAANAEQLGTTDSVESQEGTMPYDLYAIRHKDSFAIANGIGNMIGKGDGFFRDDTRVLSKFILLFGGKPLLLLSAAISQDNIYFKTQVTNKPLPPLGENVIPEGIIHIERIRFLWNERMYECLRLTNYGERAVQAPLTINFAADFRDIFEVRGKTRSKRGEMQAPVVEEDHVVLGYLGLDDKLRHSVIGFSCRPDRLTHDSAEFSFSVCRKQTVEMYLEIGPAWEESPSRSRFRAAAALARHAMHKRRRSGSVARSSERAFDEWLEKSRSDLALLTTQFETGPYPCAGIPWFSTPFGRDAIITAMQILWLDPEIARGVLAFLAQTQAQEKSSFRDSAPGKIMHETRKGEMSELGEVPFKLYYGGVDTTPLFVTLAGAYAERTGDLTFIDSIWSQLEAAMGWINSSEDPDGFLSYQSGEVSGLRNQGWKDSEDSVFHANGDFPPGPISLVEVQGYKFSALKAMATLSRYRGDAEAASYWKTQAEAIRDAVERKFWMEDRHYYALALDGNGQACHVRTSNAGHLLFSGLPNSKRAATVTEQLLSTSLNSGWGIRTLATDEVRYNPMSYHNGSVWPHDTAICAAGMARYGDRTAAAHILSQLFSAAIGFDMRLPELFCGFQHAAGEGPTAYPVACLPQAWSSGSGLMALQACLGLRVDARHRKIFIRRPALPDGINRISVKGLAVGDSRINLVFQRSGDRVTASTEGAERKRGEINIVSYI